MQLKRYYLATIGFTALFCTTPSLADKPKPHFSANGYASDYAVGKIDLTIPLSGDQLRDTRILIPLSPMVPIINGMPI